MSDKKEKMDLGYVRRKIDQLDNNILQLLQKRMEIARISAVFKGPDKIDDPGREAQVIRNLTERENALLNSEFIKDVYGKVFVESKRIQRETSTLAAFQGEHGAYSEIACRTWNKTFAPMPCDEFADIFQGVEDGIYDFGVIPVENTLGGMVDQVNGLMLRSNVFVVGAIKLPIHHCLLVTPGTDYRSIRRVYSHPQALSQCREYLKRQNLEPQRFFDTAGAAKMISETNPASSAAIASRLAASYYNLEIIHEDIEDLDTNQTRFMIIAREPVKGDGNKCSISFCTANRAGALFAVLQIFADHKVNLTRIDSVPDAPGEFAFFLDFDGSLTDPNIQLVLEKAEKAADNYRFLGCYEERSAL